MRVPVGDPRIVKQIRAQKAVVTVLLLMSMVSVMLLLPILAITALLILGVCVLLLQVIPAVEHIMERPIVMAPTARQGALFHIVTVKRVGMVTGTKEPSIAMAGLPIKLSGVV